MKMQTNNVAELQGNFGDVSEVSIQMNAFTFEALSGDKLYKNLKRAIVREISCNAYDAHVMAKNQHEPFEIHLPTDMEPWLSFRDYGIGLDEKGVRKTYLTYFDSTKRDNNQVIGAWGLGSKTPLGYVDNFSITAYKDGVQRDFAVFKRPENGIPAVTLLNECATKERNGLYIQIPVVDAYDCEVFKREALDVLRWFPVAPKLNIGELVQPTYKIENIIPGSHLREDGRMSAIHGMIEYPISMPDKYKIDEKVREMLNFPLRMEFEMGALQFSMSREELSYSEVTVKAIEKKLFEILAALEPKLEEMLANCKTDWERAVMLEKLTTVYGSIFKPVAADFLKQGKSKVHKALADRVLGFKNGIKDSCNGVLFRALQVYDSRRSEKTMVKNCNTTIDHMKDANGADTFETGYCLGIHEKVLFVINNSGRKAQARIRHYLDSNPQLDVKAVYMFDGADRMITAAEMKAAEDILNVLGNPEVMLVTSMPELPKRAATARVKKGEVLRIVNYRRRESKWEDASIEGMDDDVKYYIPLTHSTVSDTMFSDMYLSNIESIFETAKKLGIVEDDAKMFGLRKSALASVADDENWVMLSAAITEAFADKELVQKCVRRLQYHKISTFFKTTTLEIPEIQPLKDIIALQDLDMGPDRIMTILFKVGIKDLDKETEIVNNVQTKVYEKYPLLKVIVDNVSHYSLDGIKNEVMHYIELVNNTATK